MLSEWVGSFTTLACVLPLQRSFNEMQTWITELRQLGPQNLVLAIAGNKLDLDHQRQVNILRLPFPLPLS